MEKIELTSHDQADEFLITSDANLIRGQGYSVLANG
jgi:hypothetical protein